MRWQPLHIFAFGAALALTPVGLATHPLQAQDAESGAQELETEESPGQADFDEALRVRVSGEGLRDLNRTIDLLQSALDKGLQVEDAEFAEDMLSDALMQRATALMQVINSRSIHNEKVGQIRMLVTSDLRRVLAYDDAPAVASFLLGRLMALPGGDSHEARRLLTDFLEAEEITDEQRAEALVLRGRLMKDIDKAIADFDKAIELVPDNTNYKVARALLLRGHDKKNDALVAVEKILEDTPQDANALILQGELFRELDRPQEALESFDAAAELVPEAPGPYQNRGEIYRELGDYDKAITEFTKVLEIQPGVLLTLVQRAEAYLLAHQFEDALADVETVLEQQPLVAAHRIRAEALSQLGRLDEAVSEMERVAEAYSDQSELKLQLALYYLVDKKPSKAIEAYSDVLADDPDNYLALQGRADSYLNFGNHKEAVADFEQALKLQPEDTSVLNNYAWVLATSPDEQVRDGQKAIELATLASELTEYQAPHILSTLAAAYAEEGNFEEARKWSQKSIESDAEHNGGELADALQKELASYQEEKPWRERQSAEESETSTSGDRLPAQVDPPKQSLDF